MQQDDEVNKNSFISKSGTNAVAGPASSTVNLRTHLHQRRSGIYLKTPRGINTLSNASSSCVRRRRSSFFRRTIAKSNTPVKKKVVWKTFSRLSDAISYSRKLDDIIMKKIEIAETSDMINLDIDCVKRRSLESLEKEITRDENSTAIYCESSFDSPDCSTSSTLRNKTVRVFAYELSVGKGRRNFMVTEPSYLWDVLRHRHRTQRRYYEVIREGDPCKLYFDLEFDRDSNSGLDGDKLVKKFIFATIEYLKHFTGIECQPCDVLWLDSSTDSKYSCHLIYQIKEVFLNSNEVGFFVKNMCSSFSPDCPFWVFGKSKTSSASTHSKELFCDLAVYSKNRNFRLYRCTKLGRDAPLLVSRHNRYPITTKDLTFIDSMITLCAGKQVITGYGSSATSICFEEFVRARVQDSKVMASIGGSEDLKPVCSYKVSPYPDIDNFVKSLISPGRIRKWSFFEMSDVLIYDFDGYRFCRRIGRHHKSNGVFFVVDVSRGVLYQKCYDPDCRMMDFRSEPVQLPLDILPQYVLSEISVTNLENCSANMLHDNGDVCS